MESKRKRYETLDDVLPEGPAKKADGEQPKIASHRRVSEANFAWWDIVLHILSVAVSLGVLSLSWCEVYWADTGRYNDFNTTLGALQFAAKAHETLIFASISAILLHTVRRGLMGEGVALGLLNFAYSFRLGDLLRSRFWVSMRRQISVASSGSSLSWNLPFLIVVTILLTATIGPSSAIVIIPKLDWWVFSGWSGHLSVTLWIPGTFTDYYPINLTSNSFVDLNCTQPSADTIPGCPLTDYDSLISWKDSVTFSWPHANISIQTASETTYRLLLAGYDNTEGPSSFEDPSFWAGSFSACTSTSEWLASDTGNFWDFFRYDLASVIRPLLAPETSQKQQLLQPLVQTQCEALFCEDGQTYLPHDMLKTPPLDSYVNDQWPIPAQLLDKLADEWTELHNNGNTDALPFSLAFIDLTGYKTRPSLGLVLQTGPNNSITSNAATTIACSMDARWIPSDITFDPLASSFVQGGPTNPVTYVNSGQFALDMKAKSSTGNAAFQPIMIDTSWTEALEFTPSQTNISSGIRSAIIGILPGRMGTYSKTGNTTGWMTSTDGQVIEIAQGAIFASTAFGLVVTSALAQNRAHANGMLLVENHDAPLDSSLIYLNEEKTSDWLGNTSFMDMLQKNITVFDSATAITPFYTDTWTPIEWKVSRYGYGYGLRGVTTYLAMVVLLIHAFLAAIHIVFILVQGRVSNAWGSIGEIIALALNSEVAPSLKNTCVGIEEAKTWKHILQVREIDDDHLGVIIQDEVNDSKRYDRPQEGKKYG